MICPEDKKQVIVQKGMGKVDVFEDLAKMVCPCHSKQLESHMIKLFVNNWCIPFLLNCDINDKAIGDIEQHLLVARKKQIEVRTFLLGWVHFVLELGFQKTFSTVLHSELPRSLGFP